MWQALDAMARHAAGEQAFGPRQESTGGSSATYPSPAWASDFTTKVSGEHPKVQASFTSQRTLVAGVVTLMVKEEGSLR